MSVKLLFLVAFMFAPKLNYGQLGIKSGAQKGIRNEISQSDIKEIDCSEAATNNYSILKSAYDSGHYRKLDSLFKSLPNDYCQLKSSDYNSVLSLMLKFKKEEGDYEEAKTIQSKIDSIRQSKYPGTVKDTIKYRPLWKVGVGGSLNYSKIGPLGWGGGLIVGRKSQDEYFNISYDLGFLFQRTPFSINSFSAKDDDNRFALSGYTLNAEGYRTILSFPFTVFFGAPEFGLYSGVDLQIENNTFVKSFYHEFEYTYLTSPGSNTEILSYKYVNIKDFKSRSIFSKNTFVNIPMGLYLTIPVGNRSEIAVLLGYSYSLSKQFSFSEIDYSKRAGNWTLRIFFNQLYGKRPGRFSKNYSYK